MNAKYKCRKRHWPWQEDHVRAYCPGCGVDIVCNPEAIPTDWALRRFRRVAHAEAFVCPCLMESAWDFGGPAPVLLAGRVEEWRLKAATIR